MTLHQLDNSIITEFQEGKEFALNQVYQSLYRPLCYFADKLVENKEQAEDIVTESFMKVWEKRRDFDSLPKIKAFLYISVRNACLNYLKHAKTQLRSYKEIKYLGQNEESVINEAIETEVLNAIFEEIERLPAQCKEIFKLLFFKGMSTAAIAEQMNLSVQTVRNQKSKALDMLRMALLKRNIPLSVILFFLAIVGQENLN